MVTPDRNELTRREFLQRASLVVGAASAGLGLAAGGESAPTVYLVRFRNDPISFSLPVQWAVTQLQDAFRSRNVKALTTDHLMPAPATGVVIAGGSLNQAKQWCRQEGVAIPSKPESFALVPVQSPGQQVTLVSGRDARGLVYGVLELADRVLHADNAMQPLELERAELEQPANAIRSVSRLFVSEVEDKPWFYDRDFWDRYLTLLATQRFNRFNLAFGLGYDFTWEVRDAYFHFSYPFLVAPKGYEVRAKPLPDAERDQNLRMLQFISQETARRGLQFQLGLWTQAYDWSASKQANYRIEGLTPANHAAYCRDALALLLRSCPDISGVTLRTHGESGIPEGQYDFWKTIFDGVARAGRKVEIDLHAKGIDQLTIDNALATGMPVIISPKFWAEHMGLPYMQCAIRPQELPPANQKDAGFFAKSTGSRRFLRYGYGDLMREDRRYGVMHRVWPGTQRLLLWGSPDVARGYGKAASFCGSQGVELLEPLSFKGRKGSGLPGNRNAYEEQSPLPLNPKGGDFEKFEYAYRVWGRCIYNPNADAGSWRRDLRSRYGGGEIAVERSLNAASKILPLVTTAHCPSAANNNYWPELYSNMSIVDPKKPLPFDDTPDPKRFGTVTPLDPELFFGIDEFADVLLSGKPGAKYSPAWVANQLLALADEAEKQMREAPKFGIAAERPEWGRFVVDVLIQSELGRFFAYKFRAGVFFAIYLRTHDKAALTSSVDAYRNAQACWSRLADQAWGIYVPDITFGWDKHLRGHWKDRQPAINEDVADMEKLLASAPTTANSVDTGDPHHLDQALRAVEAPNEAPPAISGFHEPAAGFSRGHAVVVLAGTRKEDLPKEVALVQLRYRRVNQAEPWQRVEMKPTTKGYHAEIPAAYTDSPFPLQYYFEIQLAGGQVCLYPGLDLDRPAQPYFVVRQEA